MTSKFRPILPANNPASSSSSLYPDGGRDASDPGRPGGGGGGSSLSVPKPKRSPVYTACNHCRKRKIKCDGKTPACTRCINKRLDCEYDVEPDVSRQVSMKRKYEVMQDEASQLKELYRYLHDRPEHESIEILRRIRTTTDPLQVLRFIKEGDLLMQGLVIDSPGDGLDPRARRLDDEAYDLSPLKVRARPWTGVAHDGIVSELISSFFIYDQSFYFCFVDRDCFLTEMASMDLGRSIWCSPLLVNAICALKSLNSTRAKQYGLVEGMELAKAFFEEAQSLFDLENGKATIPTVQALLVMYIYSCGSGRDRAGLMYRYTAYEMLRRLRLDKWFHQLRSERTDEVALQEQVALSRVLWGVYCFESISAFAYLKPPLVQPPSVPRHFLLNEASLGRNEDVHGNVHDGSADNVPITVGVIGPMCDLSEILYETMLMHDTNRNGVGSPRDIEKRCSLYSKLLAYRRALPGAFALEANFTPQTYFLRSYEDKVIIGIFRPLHHGVPLPDGLGTAGRMCMNACNEDIDGLVEYERLFGFEDYSIMAVYPMYNVSMTLVSRLEDAGAQDAFTTVTRLLLGQVPHFPFIVYLFKALWALAKQLKQTLPPESVKYFKESKFPEVEAVQDVPISFVLPQHEEMAEMLSGGLGHEFDETKTHLGNLISQWNEMSLP